MKIVKAEHNQTDGIFSILNRCKNALDLLGIFQWTNMYPNRLIVEQDILNKQLYCLTDEDICIGVITINETQEIEYASIKWEYNYGTALVVHRLAIDPEYQGRGYAKKLMDFAEGFGRLHSYSSVRLDAFSKNERVLRLYEQRGYFKRGELFFPARQSPFFCYEKPL